MALVPGDEHVDEAIYLRYVPNEAPPLVSCLVDTVAFILGEHAGSILEICPHTLGRIDLASSLGYYRVL